MPEKRVPTPHSVLHLHGGWALILSQLLKCTVIEDVTGARIWDIFPTVMADSGGTILALCLHEIPARDLLQTYMESIPESLPQKGFFFTQPLPVTANRFDPNHLEGTLRKILGDKKLGDVRGNFLVHTHSLENGAGRLGKITASDGHTSYYNTDGNHSLVDIALSASAVPGIMPDYDGYIDPIATQNPTAIFVKLKDAFPDTPFHYLQLGSIHDQQVGNSLTQGSFLGGLFRGRFLRYTAFHANSLHLHDLNFAYDNVTTHSLVTDTRTPFQSTNNSIKQRTLLSIETLDDIERRSDEYEVLCLGLRENILHHTGSFMGITQSVSDIRAQVDPFMFKGKIVTDDPDSVPPSFPSPDIIPLQQSPQYIFGYAAGYIIGNALSHTKGTLTRAFKDVLASWEPKLFPKLERDSTVSKDTRAP